MRRQVVLIFLFVPLAATMLFTSLASARPAAANTWAGVWNSDFGQLTLAASGSGSYTGYSPGTVSGTVTGNVDKGTWSQPGDPPKEGTFAFTLSASGHSFTGTWAYKGGGCGTACGWNGTCLSGACLKNGVQTAPKPAAKPASRVVVNLRSPQGFVPSVATLRNGGTVQFCNRLDREEILFSRSEHKEILFHSPMYDIRLSRGQCFTHVLRNPTKKRILLRIRANVFGYERVAEPGLDLYRPAVAQPTSFGPSSGT